MKKRKKKQSLMKNAISDENVIYVPHYERIKFASLQKAVRFLLEKEHLEYYLSDIVEYNVRYRDLLRDCPLEQFKDLLIEEAPLLIDKLDTWFDEKIGELKEEIAPFDIQCRSVDDDILIYGQIFHGLAGIKKQMQEELPTNGVWVGRDSESYPCFDSFDYATENRSYQNYVFAEQPGLLQKQLQIIESVDLRANYRKINESTPVSLLPAVYYVGDGKWMLVATEKKG